MMSMKFECLPAYREDHLVFEAVEAAKGFDSLNDANRYFKALCEQDSDFINPGSNVYQYKDYFINVGKRFLMAEHADCLMSLTRHCLSFLPEGIAQVWLDNGEDMVLFTRIIGSERRLLIPYCTVPAVSDEAKRNLLADVERLMEDNYAVLAVTENKKAWYVLQEEDRIIISDSRTAYVPDKAKAAYRSRVMEALGLTD